jgi:hypothetical protein
VDGSIEAVAEFRQGSIGLLGDEHEQAPAALLVHLDVAGAAARQGGEGTGFAAALEQAADPSGGDAEKGSDMLAGADVVVTSADHAFAEVLRIGLHTSLYAAVATADCEAL